MSRTLASLLDERLRTDPTTTHVMVHALNRWMHETLTFNYHNRVLATPVVTLPIVDEIIPGGRGLLPPPDSRGSRPAPPPDRYRRTIAVATPN